MTRLPIQVKAVILLALGAYFAIACYGGASWHSYVLAGLFLYYGVFGLIGGGNE